MASQLIAITNTEYTQVVVGDNDFFQNPDNDIVYGIIANTKPSDNAEPHFKFNQYHGANGQDHKGTWWLKSLVLKDYSIAFGTKSV